MRVSKNAIACLHITWATFKFSIVLKKRHFDIRNQTQTKSCGPSSTCVSHSTWSPHKSLYGKIIISISARKSVIFRHYICSEGKPTFGRDDCYVRQDTAGHGCATRTIRFCSTPYWLTKARACNHGRILRLIYLRLLCNLSNATIIIYLLFAKSGLFIFWKNCVI